MAGELQSHEFQIGNLTTYYLEDGPSDGPLLIFLHGWPDIAVTWKHQLKTFASLGFRVVAPDMRGYGKSTAPKEREAYRLEQLVKEQLALLRHLKRDKAIWIAHDWGCGVLSALAAHYPEVLHGVVFLSVPYRILEKGLDELLTIVNRDLYPEDECPDGQWSYMRFYENNSDLAVSQLDSVSEKYLKLIYAKSDPESWGKRGPTSGTVKAGGVLGRFNHDPNAVPDIPLGYTVIDEEIYNAQVEDKKRNGWFPATAYYLNHALNREYDKSSKNDGALDVPVLYIDSKYDAVCSSTVSPKARIPMTKACKDLTEAIIEAGHWQHLEKPAETNAVLAKWLVEKFPELWPSASLQKL